MCITFTDFEWHRPSHKDVETYAKSKSTLSYLFPGWSQISYLAPKSKISSIKWGKLKKKQLQHYVAEMMLCFHITYNMS